MNDWRNYFKKLLDDVEEVRVTGEMEERGGKQEGDRRGKGQRGDKKNEEEKGSRSGWNTDGGMEVCRGEFMEKK